MAVLREEFLVCVTPWLNMIKIRDKQSNQKQMYAWTSPRCHCPGSTVMLAFELCDFPICFMHSRLALYWRHMETFTLITNISPTSLGLQSAFLVALIFKPAGPKSGLSCSVCGCLFGFMSRRQCPKKKHLLSAFYPRPLLFEQSALQRLAVDPFTGEGNHWSGLWLCGENGLLDRNHISLNQQGQHPGRRTSCSDCIR